MTMVEPMSLPLSQTRPMDSDDYSEGILALVNVILHIICDYVRVGGVWDL